jgi:cyclophilin family peptidyl-prolyl cis-trans isomerase
MVLCVSLFVCAAVVMVAQCASQKDAGSQPGTASQPAGKQATTSTQPAGANAIVVIETSMGTIKAELWADKAPLTVANFLKYVDDGHYDGLIFHRVISGFMIQGGGFTPDMEQRKTREPVKNEATPELKNDRGTLAMARTSVVDSATSQFFINHKNNSFLNQTSRDPRGFGYCAFGKVVEGMDVVDKIAAVKTRSLPGGMDDVPVEAVKIIKAQRAK